MRIIDPEGMDVVCLGLPWRHAVSPCSKQAIALLERNTKVVTWLMPHGGRPQDQIPCILYKDRYLSLSLRMQKAIYRHIRLKKGFQNEENVDGVSKLRIPDLLLKEKIRTQSRFDVSAARPYAPPVYFRGAERARARACASSSTPFAQAMRSNLSVPQRAASTATKGVSRERSKSVNTVASRMKHVVEKLIQREQLCEIHPQLTIFLYKNQRSEITNAFFQELQRENPAFFQNRADFLALITARYDDFCTTHA